MTRGERIRYVIEAFLGGDVSMVARALKVRPQAIYQWQSGKGIKRENLTALAQLAEVSLDWLANGNGPLRTNRRAVPIVGYVGAGSVFHPYEVDPSAIGLAIIPSIDSENLVAVEIRGESLGRLFDRWLAFYDNIRRPVTDDLLHRLCVLGIQDDRIVIKKIVRRRGVLFDLSSNVDDDLENVTIEWAAPVIFLAPTR